MKSSCFDLCETLLFRKTVGFYLKWVHKFKLKYLLLIKFVIIIADLNTINRMDF
jgi:hypothetical protein